MSSTAATTTTIIRHYDTDNSPHAALGFATMPFSSIRAPLSSTMFSSPTVVLRTSSLPLPIVARHVSPSFRHHHFHFHRQRRTIKAVLNSEGESGTDKDKSTGTSRKCRVFDFRHTYVAYNDAWHMQHALVDELKADDEQSDALIILEHDPVYTLGTRSSLDNILFDINSNSISRPDHTDTNHDPTKVTTNKQRGINVVRTERGGEITYHGPGQVVLYPILNLKRHTQDLHWYLRTLEKVVMDMLERDYALQRVHRKEGLTGVWVNGDSKVCAMGLKVSKWITMHGLALNVHMDLSPFDNIVPCGIHQFHVTSLQQLLGRDVCVDDVRDRLLHSFNQNFGPYDFEQADITRFQSFLPHLQTQHQHQQQHQQQKQSAENTSTLSS